MSLGGWFPKFRRQYITSKRRHNVTPQDLNPLHPCCENFISRYISSRKFSLCLSLHVQNKRFLTKSLKLTTRNSIKKLQYAPLSSISIFLPVCKTYAYTYQLGILRKWLHSNEIKLLFGNETYFHNMADAND
jgi:hypothetical protein